MLVSCFLLQEFVIDAASNKAVDALLTYAMTTQDTDLGLVVAMKAGHAAINLKLRHAVALAQKDMATFVQDTSQ